MIYETFEKTADELFSFVNKNNAIYLKCEPEIVDFRKEYEGEIVMFGKEENIKIKIPTKHFSTFIGMLFSFVFTSGKSIYTWSIKNLFSYIYFRWAQDNFLNCLGNIVDIKYGEAFLGINNNPPQSFCEAEARGQVVVKNDQAWNIHHRIHIPLATRVLPKMETRGFCDTKNQNIRYANYEIEGQTNGRLRCREIFEGGLLIHNLNKEEKINIKPSKMDSVFVTFDFKAMEVVVLQWLSKDERLGKIISSGRDIYTTIHALLHGTKCNPEQRQFIKDSFLPVVYGLQADTLSKNLQVEKSEAIDLIYKIEKYFSKAMSWAKDISERAKNGSITDYFGRPRMNEGRPWAARNAAVQGPASVVCLEKLIALFSKQKVVGNIHDAYVVECLKKNAEDVVGAGIEILESPSEMIPGLKLKVGVKISDSLG